MDREPIEKTPCPACGAGHPYILSHTKGPAWDECALRCSRDACSNTYVVEREGDDERISSDHATAAPRQTINNAAMDEFVTLFDRMREHARACHRCTVPVLDAEGNPGKIFDACVEGAVMIREYLRLEPFIEFDEGSN